MAYPTFAELAHRLIEPYPAADQSMASQLKQVNEAFDLLIEHLAPVVPAGPEATHAARDIHRAAQSVITAIVISNRSD
jgi:hypothetical protein